MKRITEITKRDILDLFRNGLDIDEFFDTKTVTYHYFGRLEELDFLKRIYDLKTILKSPLALSAPESAIRYQVNGLFQKFHVKPNIIMESSWFDNIFGKHS